VLIEVTVSVKRLLLGRIGVGDHLHFEPLVEISIAVSASQ